MWLTDAEDDTDLVDDDGGCVWPVEHCCTPSEALDPDTVEWTTQMAASIMWAASGRQYGICTETFRPCPPACPAPSIQPLQHDLLTDRAGAYGGLSWSLAPWHCSCRSDPCSCSTTRKILLPRKRYRSVVEVVIDGVVLDPSAYRLDGRTLYRLDGEDWPDCQDWNVAPGEVGSWEVTLRVGRPLPPGGPHVTGLLACQLALACTGDDQCELPKHVQTVTRDGVTIGFLDPMSFLDDGLTGITEVDLWIKAWNPGKLIRPARVHSYGRRKLARKVRRPSGGS